MEANEADGDAHRGRGDSGQVDDRVAKATPLATGGLALPAVTLDLMHQRRPDARIAVLTDSPCLSRAYFPRAEGISVVDQDPWAPATRLERLAEHLAPRTVGPIVLARLRPPDRLRT